ncbi:MAG: hypothetical protein ACRDTE_13705 [Pseudonocardiaceae bacterium]
MIDLDPLWRLGIVFGAFAVVPLLLGAAWAARKASETCTAALLRTRWRRYCRRKRHYRRGSARPKP